MNEQKNVEHHSSYKNLTGDKNQCFGFLNERTFFFCFIHDGSFQRNCYTLIFLELMLPLIYEITICSCETIRCSRNL